ncbi:hypothetical protein PSAB6_220172 [Paraburkholderia sabiae]|nr:hypothetical protein PSAB6_220172 [Paraburkholderia sabiae]
MRARRALPYRDADEWEGNVGDSGLN